MKIAILVANYVPNAVGGTEIATYNTAKNLVERGHEVHVITSFFKGMPKETKEDGIIVYRCRIIRKPFLRFFFYLICVLRIVKRVNPDLIHVKSISIGLFAVLVMWLLKKPYLIWVQGSDIYSPLKFIKPFYKIILTNADVVIAQNNDEKRIIENMCNTDVVVIPNGVDLTEWVASNLSKEKSRKELHIKEDEKIILFVGTLRRVKGVSYLIEAMKSITQKYSDVRLILVGDGQERQNLEELVSDLDLGDFIKFRGRVPHNEVLKYMIAADIFALPSLSEGFPLVILESMASGLPIITTDVGGLKEIVKDGWNGFLVKPKNSAQIADKVMLLLEDNELVERISKTNRHEANNYSWEKAVDRLEEVYKMIGQPR